jgi:hypothetical protein
VRLPRIPIPEPVERRLDGALDAALRYEAPVVAAYVDRIRRSRPNANPAEVVELLETRYKQAAMGVGAASGGMAAVPGVGTATSIAAGGAEIAAFVSATALYVLALARVYGIPTHDPDVRRALVFGVLLGEGSLVAAEGPELAGKHWAQFIHAANNKDNLTGFNGRLMSMALRRFTTRQGALVLGRALPVGIGAGIGAIGNAALARASIKAARRAFGPAPATFGPRVVEGYGTVRAPGRIEPETPPGLPA